MLLILWNPVPYCIQGFHIMYLPAFYLQQNLFLDINRVAAMPRTELSPKIYKRKIWDRQTMIKCSDRCAACGHTANAQIATFAFEIQSNYQLNWNFNSSLTYESFNFSFLFKLLFILQGFQITRMFHQSWNFTFFRIQPMIFEFMFRMLFHFFS